MDEERSPRDDERDEALTARETSFQNTTERSQPEKRLRDLEAKVAALFRASPAAMVIAELSKGGRLIDVNKAWEQLTGYVREEALGRAPVDVGFWSKPETFAHLLSVVQSTGKVRNLEFEFCRRDGTIRTGLMSLELLILDREPCLVSITTDVTEHRRTEADLAKVAAWRQVLIDQSRDGIVILDVQKHIVFEANRSFAGMLGYTLEELYRLYIWDWDVQWPRQELAEMQSRAMATPAQTFQTRHRRKDGSCYDAEVSFIPAQIGDRDFVFCLVRDISDRKAAEAALRRSEERYRLLAETIMDVIWSVDPETFKLLYVSPSVERLLGYRVNEVMALNVLTLFPPESAPAVREAAASLMVRCKQGEATTCARELELLRKDGTRLWAELKCFAVSGNENPSPHVAIQGILVDITGRKRAEEEKAALQRQLALAQKLESVGQLAGGIAHDFNNLLTVINGYSDLLLNRLGEDDPLWKHVAEIRRAGQQGAALTKQLLTFSRGQIVQPKPLCLNDVIAEIESMLRRLMGDDIIVETALDPSLGLVMADPGQLHQVLLNFAANSRDAMPDGGGFRIVTANVEIGEDEVGRMPGLTAGLFVSLQVSDTGTGIPRELQQRIFDPFFTTKGHGKGTGLGLATVYGIVRQNGGVVSVSSEVANGTTFLILLPRIQTPLLDSPAEDSPKALAGKETVLVVEDRAEIRELIAEALREHGYTVWQAARGSEALEISGRRRGPIHLLLTDVTMPHMNGRELAERLRVLRPEVNVLYMSGYAADMSGHVGQPKSGERYIAKPFSINSLLAIVRDILNKAGFETAS